MVLETPKKEFSRNLRMDITFHQCNRALFSFKGKDRIKWLQEVYTNDIAKLQSEAEACCMGAFCRREGKMVAFGVLRRIGDEILFETDLSVQSRLFDHFNKYIISEDVEVVDISSIWAVFSVQGLSHKQAFPEWVFHRSSISLESMQGTTFIIKKNNTSAFEKFCITEGFSLLTEEQVEKIRIEEGFPAWGKDMTEEELPVEAGLEPIAISYEKGCYLGQEVILRLKTYGEPSKMLNFIQFEGDQTPQRGAILVHEGREAGIITSACFSEKVHRPVALAYVKKQFKDVPFLFWDGEKVKFGPLPWRERLFHQGGN